MSAAQGVTMATLFPPPECERRALPLPARGSPLLAATTLGDAADTLRAEAARRVPLFPKLSNRTNNLQATHPFYPTPMLDNVIKERPARPPDLVTQASACAFIQPAGDR